MRIGFVLVAVVAAAFAVASVSMLIFNIQPPLYPVTVNKKPTVNIVIYAGEMGQAKFGFGNTPQNITSPGPTLRFKVGDVVNVTMVNVGYVSHAFAITDGVTQSSHTLYNAVIATANDPLPPGAKGSVTFTPTSAGQAYYICPVPGHAQLGMWGHVIISPAG